MLAFLFLALRWYSDTTSLSTLVWQGSRAAQEPGLLQSPKEHQDGFWRSSLWPCCHEASPRLQVVRIILPLFILPSAHLLHSMHDACQHTHCVVPIFLKRKLRQREGVRQWGGFYKYRLSTFNLKIQNTPKSETF
jgi:hypothetical protein